MTIGLIGSEMEKALGMTVGVRINVFRIGFVMGWRWLSFASFLTRKHVFLVVTIRTLNGFRKLVFATWLLKLCPQPASDGV